MSNIDALTSGCFKKASDGRWLFFPYGWGQGYIIDSEQEYEKLRRRVALSEFAWLILFFGALVLQRYAAAILIGVLYLAVYAIWVRYLRRGLEPSGERLSLEERMTAQAVASSAVSLWLMVIGALAFVGLGLFLFIVEPRIWSMGLATIILFGACAALGARMLVLRRRAKAGSAR